MIEKIEYEQLYEYLKFYLERRIKIFSYYVSILSGLFLIINFSIVYSQDQSANLLIIIIILLVIGTTISLLFIHLDVRFSQIIGEIIKCGISIESKCYESNLQRKTFFERMNFLGNTKQGLFSERVFVRFMYFLGALLCIVAILLLCVNKGRLI